MPRVLVVLVVPNMLNLAVYGWGRDACLSAQLTGRKTGSQTQTKGESGMTTVGNVQTARRQVHGVLAGILPHVQRKIPSQLREEYFVFTDAPAIEYEDAPGVHRIYQEPYPWPYSTLKRFSIFLTQRSVLSKMDYLFFFNANLTCTQTITEEEFLPRPARGENLLLVQQPGFWDKKPPFFSYDRNPKSTAYIPYNCGKYYVSGGLNGGTAPAFLALCHELERRTEADLQQNVSRTLA